MSMADPYVFIGANKEIINPKQLIINKEVPTIAIASPTSMETYFVKATPQIPAPTSMIAKKTKDSCFL
jgi:hypothetical protein